MIKVIRECGQGKYAGRNITRVFCDGKEIEEVTNVDISLDALGNDQLTITTIGDFELDLEITKEEVEIVNE